MYKLPTRRARSRAAGRCEPLVPSFSTFQGNTSDGEWRAHRAKLLLFFRSVRAFGRCLALAIAMIVALPAVSRAVAVPGPTPTQEWTRQLGTSSQDWNFGVSADGLGSVYVSGYTEGNLGGTNAGGRDVYVGRYDAGGNLLWARQLGTTSDDQSYSVSADGLGNVYSAGYTAGNLGGTNAGSFDALLTKYSASGNLLWTRLLGTNNTDEARSVSADGLGNVYISGITAGNLGGTSAGDYDAFLSRYDASGNLLWTRQLGTSTWDESDGVSSDGLGNVYITGITGASLGGTHAGSDDAFLAKYSASGNLLWARQLGTSGLDGGNSVSADGLGNVYIAGGTRGSLAGNNAGGYDAFLAKYDASGNLLWTRQLGTFEHEQGQGVSADGLGNVYMAGYTFGGLDGANAGNVDTFVSKFNAQGDLLWTSQIGTSRYDWGMGVSADGMRNVYVAGRTGGSLGGPFIGGTWDAFVAKYAEVPEPKSVTLLTAVAIVALSVMRRRS